MEYSNANASIKSSYMHNNHDFFRYSRAAENTVFHRLSAAAQFLSSAFVSDCEQINALKDLLLCPFASALRVRSNAFPFAQVKMLFTARCRGSLRAGSCSVGGYARPGNCANDSSGIDCLRGMHRRSVPRLRAQIVAILSCSV